MMPKAYIFLFALFPTLVISNVVQDGHAAKNNYDETIHATYEKPDGSGYGGGHGGWIGSGGGRGACSWAKCCIGGYRGGPERCWCCSSAQEAMAYMQNGAMIKP